MPQVLNLRGRNGTMPEGAVYIGDRLYRGPWHLPKSKWANPYKIGRDGTSEEVIAKFECHLYDTGLFNDIHELRGRDLACWCAPEPCHGDLLLGLANAASGSPRSERARIAGEAVGEVLGKNGGGRQQTRRKNKCH